MAGYRRVYIKLLTVVLALVPVLIGSVLLGLTIGSSGHVGDAWDVLLGQGEPNATLEVIIWQLRWPRVVRRQPSVRPFLLVAWCSRPCCAILWQSLISSASPGARRSGRFSVSWPGFSFFPGLALSSFAGSLCVLLLVLLLTGRKEGSSDSLLLGGVMVNAFCGAIIMFLISISQTGQMHKIIFWLMGDLSAAGVDNLPLLLGVLPCFLVIFTLAQPLNLLLTGRESASAMGVNVKLVMLVLLVTTSLMVSLTVCHSGLIGFVGLTIPHVLRMTVGPDHRGIDSGICPDRRFLPGCL